MPKPFAVGARIEHHQSMVDGVQYGAYAGHPRLGAAEYALTARGGDRGVYTFCMCPGGQVIPSVSDPGLLCVNGMSYHARDGENANSALIVQVSPKDYPPGPLGGVVFQEEMERQAYNVTNSYAAPTQRVEDFLRRRPTRRLGAVKPTYPLGQAFCSLDDVLPDYVCRSLREALPHLGRKLRGFDSQTPFLPGWKAEPALRCGSCETMMGQAPTPITSTRQGRARAMLEALSAQERTASEPPGRSWPGLHLLPVALQEKRLRL